jgi:hypothetical protein
MLFASAFHINISLHAFHTQLPTLQRSGMMSDKQETSYTLVFGIASILIAFTALMIAFLQLRRMDRVRIKHIYELE